MPTTNSNASPLGLTDPPPWTDAEEAAACLGITPHTLRRLAREGRSPITVRRVGGRWRWSRADLNLFLLGQPQSPIDKCGSAVFHQL